MSIEQTRAGQELIQIGEQRGEQRTLVSSIERFLSFRFGALPVSLVERLGRVESLDRLRALQDRAFEVPDLESFSREL